MLGAIIGDIVGSRLEWNNYRSLITALVMVQPCVSAV